jgi:NADH-quinone oxidoreductase subunit G
MHEMLLPRDGGSMSERKQHRGKVVTIIIDGIECHGVYGETILEIARANDIYIPTMCYLTKVSPITTCRMCVVEVQGVDGHVLSCQEKAVDGTIITTNNSELFKHRQNIMKMYDVNHPLQCGVCDKSGECDLQNKTLEFAVDSQEFAVKEPARKKKKWGILGYDPSLCIMCEKCVHTCNEVIGSAALYVKPGGYKSIIDIKMSRCEQCGDCISVCPVGALISNEYKYSANAWESKKVPATCAHCSSGCAIYYEVKSAGVANPYEKKITRVTNDFEFNELCGAGRFGFHFENKGTGKNSKELQSAVEAVKTSDSIRFNSFITNEEALILQKIKEETGIKLVNTDAMNFQKFIKSYESITGKALYDGTNETIRQSDAVIMIGTRISRDNPVVKYSANIATKKQRADFIYMHPIDDVALQNKYNQFVKYEVGSEEGVMALLASYLIKQIPSELEEYFDNLDIGYLSGECSVGEEEFDLIVKKLKRRRYKTLVLGEDLLGHPRASHIAKLAGAINRYTDFQVVIIPSQTNTLGVSLICDLDDEVGSKVVGYNEEGDFIISSSGVGDIEVPALNQQEGTFVNIDKKVVNTNVALSFEGYCLNDIANEILQEKKENTIDYTSILPTNKGFIPIDFDSLQNRFDKRGNDTRGYYLYLEVMEKEQENISLEEVEDIETYNGTIVYRCEPLHQFNKNTGKSLLLQTNKQLRGSNAFATAAKIKDGDEVNIRYNNQIIKKVFKIDKNIKGTVALYPTFDNDFHNDLIEVGYRFKKVQIQKVEA